MKANPFRFSLRLSGFLWASTLIAGSSAMYSATFPDGFISIQVATGLSSPTAMAFAPDGRLFVCEQSGRLRVIKNDVLLTKPFLTVTVNSSGERGLLGVAFDPNFSANQRVYIYYTATYPALHNRISRFTASGDTALAGSEVIILDLNNLSGATNHNGGAIHFGPDGKLYAGVGENANGTNAQSMSNLLGKMLRMNSDGTIPTDNPWYDSSSVIGNNKAIWALGLRNPFTFAFQPGTGRMFINDVGETSWEEINDGIAGSNYGWPTTEGSTSDPRFRSPVYAYGHGSGCAIAGAAFYNPAAAQFPSSYTGKFFFADFCGGWIRVLDPANQSATSFATGIGYPVDLQVSSDGSLYYLYRSGGGVAKVVFDQPLPVQISSFTGVVVGNNNVRLDWRTISEVNNYGFYVQKRLAGVTEWTEIENSFVPGHGTTLEPQLYTFTDSSGIMGPTQYRLKQVDLNGSIHYTEPILVDMPTSVSETAPRQFALEQNYPNPFNPSTEIRFALETTGYATLAVHNSLGQNVATLFGGVAEAGRFNTVRFNATGLASGVYFYRLQSGGKSMSRKLMLLR
jgi:glucose/arabinose dehydrogenase